MERTGVERDRLDAGDRLDVGFEPVEEGDGYGLLVVDPIERRQFRMYTADTVEPRAADPDRLRFPVDAAVTVRTEQVTLPTVVATYVRDADGGMVAEVEHFAEESVDAGTYVVEVCAPVKLYLRVEGPLTVSSDVASTRIAFDGVRDVTLGARSHHDRPATTVTTTDEPRDVMRAVSTFGSALKTTTPERSYPTLRGHPPLVERGDELSVPDGLRIPETGVRLELPPELDSVYVATPLAYYLGARVVPGADPRLVTETGFVHDLDPPRGFECEVERVLKQTFLLDCVTRTEGLYRVDLHERSVLLDRIDLDLERLYQLPLADQLREYLSVPYDAIRDVVPEWSQTTHVTPAAEHVELLPFVTNDLAVVRTPTGSQVPGSSVQSEATASFARTNSAGAAAERGSVASFLRGASEAGEADGWNERSFFRPEPDDSLEQVWVGDGAPVGASKATREAYSNRLERSPVEGDIGITVVCNDPLMAVERDMVEAAYGAREDLPFDVDVHYDLTTEELRAVLGQSTEFLHYVGHIDDDGFECADGKLDAGTLETVGPDAFLLNACRSYDQGQALIGGGAISGIVTLSDVVNSSAVTMGRTLARLLNAGFPLQSALEVASEDSPVGEQYVVVGVGNFTIAQSTGGLPNVCRVSSVGDGYELEFVAYPTNRYGMGSMVQPYIPGIGEQYLASGTVDTFDLSQESLLSFLELDGVPVRYDGSLQWSTALSADDF